MVRRVLHLTSLLSVYGVSQYMRTIGRGLQSRGIRFGVLALGDNGLPYDRQWYETEGFDVLLSEGHIPQYSRIWHRDTWRRARHLTRQVRASVAAFDPDVVQANSLLMGCLYSASGLGHRLPPLVSCIHGNAIEPAKLAAGRRLGRLWPRIYGSRSIAISRDMVGFLSGDLKVRPQIIRYVPNGVDDTRFRPPAPEERDAARRALGIPLDARVVSLVGQYDRRKGHHLLLEAIGLLRTSGLDTVMLCAGSHHESQSYKAALRERAHELGIADRLLLLDHTDSRQVYWAADAGVLPSSHEGAPLVILEGMLCGTVQVRTPTSGFNDTTIDGETGFVVPFDDPAAIADRLARLFNDPHLRQRMQQRGLIHARTHFSADRMVESTVEVYEEVVRCP